MSSEKRCCSDEDCYCTILEALYKNKENQVDREFEDSRVSYEEYAKFLLAEQNELQEQTGFTEVATSLVNFPEQKKEVEVPKPPKKKSRNNLQDSRRELANQTRKGLKQQDKYSTDASVRKDSCLGGKHCSCSSFNHWSLIPEVITRHYRDVLYGPGSSSKKRFEWAQSQIADFYLKSRDKHCREGKTGDVKLDYFLESPITGKTFQVCFGVWQQVTRCASKDKLSNIRESVVNRHEFRYKDSSKSLDEQFKDSVSSSKQKSAEYCAVLAFLDSCFEEIADKSPDTRFSELPSGSKIDYYRMFCEEWQEGLLTGVYYRSYHVFKKGVTSDNDAELECDVINQAPPSLSFFYKVWRAEYGHLKVPKKQNRFSKCDWCGHLKSQIALAKEVEERKYWRTRLYDHYRWSALQRRKYQKHRQKAAKQPHK